MLTSALCLVVAGTLGADPEPYGRNVRGTYISATALVGSGVSVAPGPTGAIANRSAVQLTLDAGFSHPVWPWLEFSPAVLLELERGVGFGLAFRMRAFVPTRRVRPYLLVGVPAFLAPYQLLGAQVAGGLALQLHRSFAFAFEAGPSVFYAGNDLAEGSLTKFDGAAGIRVSF